MLPGVKKLRKSIARSMTAKRRATTVGDGLSQAILPRFPGRRMQKKGEAVPPSWRRRGTTVMKG